VEQKQLTLLEHMGSPTVLRGVRELYDKQIFDKMEFEIPKDRYSKCLRKH
jgi:hypothetical protein